MNDETYGVAYFSSHGFFRGEEAGIAPVPKDMPGVKGIYLGGCIERGIGRISQRIKCELAHAHTDGERRGWVCFQNPEYFNSPDYHWIRMHELAHITTGEGHTDRWRAEMLRLGQVIPRRYQRRGSKENAIKR